MIEVAKASGGELDFETLTEFMIWLGDNQGDYLKEELRALFKQFLFSRKGKLSANDRVEYNGLENSFGNVLQFYGTELQSHAGQLLGLSILIFTIIQAWGQLVTSNVPRNPMLFAAFVGLLGMGIVHQMLRLYRYGKQASAILHSSLNSYTADKTKLIKRGWPWEKLSNLTKVSLHSDVRFEETARLRKIGLYYLSKKEESFRQSLWAFPAGFATAFLLSYLLIFSSSDWSNLLLFAVTILVSLIIVAVVDTIRWRFFPLRGNLTNQEQSQQ